VTAPLDPRLRAVATSRNPYLHVLRLPGALAFSAAAFLGRMSMSMYGLGIVLLVASVTGRYGLAGEVAAAGSVGYALVSPFIAVLADRLGQGRVLLRQGALFALTAATFIMCAQLRAPVVVLLLTSTTAGALMPSTGSMVRTRWSALLGAEPSLLHAAFALESVNDELIFVIGPALVTLLATQVFPVSGVGTAALLCVTGTLALGIQRRTEPAPQSRVAPPTRRWPGLPAAGLVVLAPAALLLGGMFAAMDLSTVAFATQLHHRPAAGLVLGTFALGSAIGGLWYGSRQWRAPLHRRLAITVTLAVTGVSTFWATPGLIALACAGLLAGFWIAPTLIGCFAILERQAAPHRQTEAMSWFSSTMSLGLAAGSALAGHVIDVGHARWGFGCAAGFGILAVLTCLAGLRKLRSDQEPEPARAQ
jgi:MFS family permease